MATTMATPIAQTKTMATTMAAPTTLTQQHVDACPTYRTTNITIELQLKH
jgi:hypothetical protein